ncbi:MAG: hypothetical protein QXF15_02180 [Candidatus Aenigmatarchaeota archaeon]|nr:hypothetical protein [Candidatus Aenigmarchaeota archaeon]
MQEKKKYRTQIFDSNNPIMLTYQINQALGGVNNKNKIFNENSLNVYTLLNDAFGGKKDEHEILEVDYGFKIYLRNGQRIDLYELEKILYPEIAFYKEILKALKVYNFLNKNFKTKK